MTAHVVLRMPKTKKAILRPSSSTRPPSPACWTDDKVALDVLGKPSLRRRLFRRVIKSFRRQKIFLFSSLVIVVMWSCACASFAEELHETATTDPGNYQFGWSNW